MGVSAKGSNPFTLCGLRTTGETVGPVTAGTGKRVTVFTGRSEGPVHHECIDISVSWMLERGWQTPNDVEP